MFQAHGYSYCHGDVQCKGTFGCYWPENGPTSKYIFLNAKEKSMRGEKRNCGLSLRLVED